MSTGVEIDVFLVDCFEQGGGEYADEDHYGDDGDAAPGEGLEGGLLVVTEGDRLAEHVAPFYEVR